ncbi:MAG: arsenate reductase [Vicinamibacterales bacterium]
MSAVVTMYGIRNCDTVKKARAWLAAHQIEHAFHDFKSAGIDRAHLERWCRVHGWETVLNRAGTTFRKLPDAEKQNLSEPAAIRVMLEHPSAIKRPVLEAGPRSVVGFTPEHYTELFG